MKKILTLTLAAGLIFAATDTFAHCGSCGTEKPHTHAEQASAKTEMSSILETAKAAGSFTTLIAAIEAAGLEKALSGEGPFTVFAPTDEAFAALPKGTVESLLKDKEKLTAILTYHVVEGTVEAKDVVGIDKAKTLNGASFAVKAADDKVMVDDAKVVKTDIACSNGVIHVIDKVLLP